MSIGIEQLHPLFHDPETLPHPHPGATLVDDKRSGITDFDKAWRKDSTCDSNSNLLGQLIYCATRYYDLIGKFYLTRRNLDNLEIGG